MYASSSTDIEKGNLYQSFQVRPPLQQMTGVSVWGCIAEELTTLPNNANEAKTVVYREDKFKNQLKQALGTNERISEGLTLCINRCREDHLSALAHMLSETIQNEKKPLTKTEIIQVLVALSNKLKDKQPSSTTNCFADFFNDVINKLKSYDTEKTYDLDQLFFTANNLYKIFPRLFEFVAEKEKNNISQFAKDCTLWKTAKFDTPVACKRLLNLGASPYQCFTDESAALSCYYTGRLPCTSVIAALMNEKFENAEAIVASREFSYHSLVSSLPGSSGISLGKQVYITALLVDAKAVVTALRNKGFQPESESIEQYVTDVLEYIVNVMGEDLLGNNSQILTLLKSIFNYNKAAYYSCSNDQKLIVEEFKNLFIPQEKGGNPNLLTVKAIDAVLKLPINKAHPIIKEANELIPQNMNKTDFVHKKHKCCLIM